MKYVLSSAWWPTPQLGLVRAITRLSVMTARRRAQSLCRRKSPTDGNESPQYRRRSLAGQYSTPRSNDFGEVGYSGPAPPANGAHHDHFQAYTLDEAFDLEPGLTKQQLLEAVKGHVLDEGELVGAYGR